MSVVHKVIVMNRPLKIRGFTLLQWTVMVVAIALAFYFGSQVAAWMPDLKIANVPLGAWVGIGILCGAAVFVAAPTMKPMVWWRNRLAFLLGIQPRQYMPKSEPAIVYLDASIVEPGKKTQETYIAVEQ
ncbi:MAG: hypothetical protein K2Y22_05165 [Candidatus Obscuribacterales bacterium]|nr:hypothetical protein [Candidatus Obscuribacterales bacterium]